MPNKGLENKSHNQNKHGKLQEFQQQQEYLAKKKKESNFERPRLCMDIQLLYMTLENS